MRIKTVNVALSVVYPEDMVDAYEAVSLVLEDIVTSIHPVAGIEITSNDQPDVDAVEWANSMLADMDKETTMLV